MAMVINFICSNVDGGIVYNMAKGKHNIFKPY